MGIFGKLFGPMFGFVVIGVDLLEKLDEHDGGVEPKIWEVVI